jgi:CHASE3 domain sensor protein
MVRKLEEQKSKLKKQLNQEIDAYYERFEAQSNESDFTIDQIERLMVENQEKIKESLRTANEELTSSVDVSVKKTVLPAETS